MPHRLQLHRTRGYRRPEGAVVVSRPSRWGNPYRIGAPHPDTGAPMTRSEAIDLYRQRVLPALADRARRELRGHDLACWCPLDEPCHADVLLEAANR